MAAQANWSAAKVYNVGASAVQLLGADNERTGLTFGQANVQNITISHDPGIVAGAGILRRATDLPWTACCCDVGNWVKGPIFAIAAGAGASIYIIEKFGDPEQEP